MFGQDLGNLMAREMDNRSGIVRGSSSSKLNDPITDVGLNHLDAMLGQKRGEAYFSGDVRF